MAKMAIRPDTEIRVTLGAAMGGAAILVAGAAAIVYFVFGEAKDDIATIRSDLSELRQQASDGEASGLSTDLGLRQELSELTAQLRVTTTELSSLGETVGGLDASIQAVDDKLSSSVQRQVGFEAFVIARLGLGPESIPSLPTNWSESQGAILKQISAGPDPLLIWSGAGKELPQ